MAGKWVGRRIKRKEDPRLIQGLGHYVDDIHFPGTLYMAFSRSPYGHAKIRSIDTSAARNMPGVVEVLTGADIRGKLGNVPTAGTLPGLKVPDHPCLAVGKVCHVGDPVAVVIAEDRYLATDAVEKIDANYDPLPVLVDAEKASRKSTPPIHKKFKDNIAYVLKSKSGDWSKIKKQKSRWLLSSSG